MREAAFSGAGSSRSPKIMRLAHLDLSPQPDVKVGHRAWWAQPTAFILLGGTGAQPFA
jgi:hypothetical protein